MEYLIGGVSQIQTHEQIGLTFESLLRRVFGRTRHHHGGRDPGLPDG